MDPPIEPLPQDAVLLHIGPYKTGSTALQAALFAAKAELERHGVAYPGRWRRIVGAGHAVLGQAPRGRDLPPISVWEHFAEQVRARDRMRVCVSTEDFSELSHADRFPKIIEDLGGERVHVVAVARAYHRLLPSFWQQSIKAKGTRRYDDWLHMVLDEDGSGQARDRFWRTNDIERTAGAYLPLVGQDRFRVVIADDNNPRHLLEVFESLLGLPPGLLQLTEVTNASLTANGVEVLRRFNKRFSAAGWPDEDYFALIQSGLIYGIQDAERTEHDQKLPNLPSWAVERVQALTERRIEFLTELGGSVIGDPNRLRLPDDYQPDDSGQQPEIVSVETMVSGVERLMDALVKQRERWQQAAAAAKPPPPPGLSSYRAETLAKELARRTRRRAIRELRRVRRR